MLIFDRSICKKSVQITYQKEKKVNSESMLRTKRRIETIKI